MSFRYSSGINKPGFNPLGAQTSTNTYFPYLYSWATNDRGQLGLGNVTNYSSPKQVGALTTWSTLDGGAEHTLSVTVDGALWVWGRSLSGVLGLGNTTSYSSPKQVG